MADELLLFISVKVVFRIDYDWVAYSNCFLAETAWEEKVINLGEPGRGAGNLVDGELTKLPAVKRSVGSINANSYHPRDR